VITPFQGKQSRTRAALIEKVLNSDFDSDFSGGGAVVREESVGEAGFFGDFFGEIFGGRVEDIPKKHMVEGGGLLGDSLGDVRVGMPMNCHPPGTGAIPEASPIVGI
jgi:hypothetical protein